jgi:hypothetical protein
MGTEEFAKRPAGSCGFIGLILQVYEKTSVLFACFDAAWS